MKMGVNCKKFQTSCNIIHILIMLLKSVNMESKNINFAFYTSKMTRIIHAPEYPLNVLHNFVIDL